MQDTKGLTNAIMRFATAALLLVALAASGCHTVKGAGQDVESAGKSMEHASQK